MPIARTALPVRMPIVLRDPSAQPLGKNARKDVLIGPENPTSPLAGPPLQDQALPGDRLGRIAKAAPETRGDARTLLAMRENPDLPKDVKNAPNDRSQGPGAMTAAPLAGMGHRRNQGGAPRWDRVPRPGGQKPRDRQNGEAGVDPSASLSS